MANDIHLTFVEELVLLALDDTTGAPLPLPAAAFGYALAGALICDLSLLNRVDTDPEKLVVLSTATTCDPILDQALQTLSGTPETLPVSRWLGVFSENTRVFQNAAIDRLVARGVLRLEEKKILWVFGVRRYPTIDNQERTEVRTRLAALILGDDLPDPRDSMLISLLVACHLAETIFAGPEFNARSARIAQLAKMDLVGREVATSLDTLTRALRSALPLGM
ncbi:MAG: GPP34 family phosphoprotein [Verrucomicrobiota bacterium]